MVRTVNGSDSSSPPGFPTTFERGATAPTSCSWPTPSASNWLVDVVRFGATFSRFEPETSDDRLRREASVKYAFQFGGRHRSLSKDAPRCHREVDHTRDVARSLAAVDGAIQLFAIGESLEHFIGAVTRLLPVFVGAGDGEGTEYGHHSTQGVVVGNAKARSVVFVAEHHGQLVGHGDDDGERSGPEGVGESLGHIGPLDAEELDLIHRV